MTWHLWWTTLLIVAVAPLTLLALAIWVSQYRHYRSECHRLRRRLAEAAGLVSDLSAVLDWYSTTQRMTDDERAWEAELRRRGVS